jgi:pimeloyl-ACP methyl ester carboxylesterase/predicted lipid carrier protein YhbT
VSAEPSAHDLEALFRQRLAAGLEPVLAVRKAAVLFDLGPAGQWTLTLDHGRPDIHRGTTRHPATVVRTDIETFTSILDGRTSGAAAFLGGQLVVRGDLSLGLQLDGAFAVERPKQHPRAAAVNPLGVRTTYIEAGDPDAPAVVCLHGLGATAASLLPVVLGLADNYRVIAPDLPGFGDSDAPRWRYRANDFGQWFSAFLRAVGVQRTHVIGNSLGGRVALEAALVAPDRVDRLVLLCPAPALRRLRQFVPVVRLLSPELARMRVPLSHRAVVGGIRLMFSRPDRLPDSWYDAGADEFVRVMRDWPHRRAFYATLRQIYVEEPFGTRGFWTRLTRITAPALFIWGARDRLVPASFAKHVTTALPNSQSLVLPDCGHVPQFELPERTLELTREFLTAT